VEDLCTDVREIPQLIYKKQNWFAQTELIRVSIETEAGSCVDCNEASSFKQCGRFVGYLRIYRTKLTAFSGVR